MPVCPVCVAAVCAGLGLSRWLGVDDLVSGVWIGGVLVSLIFLAIQWLNKKSLHFTLRNFLVVLSFYASVLIPLYLMKIIGQPSNKFCGVDKLLAGIACGSIFFAIGVNLSQYLKKRNQGKAYFPFQKIIVPVLFLLVLSLIFSITTRG